MRTFATIVGTVAMLLFLASCAESTRDPAAIVVYGSPMCPECTSLRNELDSRNIDYDFVDLSSDQSAVNELSRKLAREAWFSGSIEMPVVEVSGELLRRPSVNRVLAVRDR